MMRTNIGNVPLEKELLTDKRNWSKHLEYTENLWRKDIQGLNITGYKLKGFRREIFVGDL